MSRGNSKTEGFKSRVLPIGGKVSKYLKDDHSRETISVLAAEQAKEIKTFKDRLKTALALVAAGGEWESVGKASYERAYETLDRLDHEVDGFFFEHLWARLEGRETGEGGANEAATAFRTVMYERTRALFMATLPSIPSRSLFRPRAESRARSFFFGTIYRDFPDLRSKDDEAELQNDDHDTEEMIENG
jgi:CRISPR system Cascade subunit CasA